MKGEAYEAIVPGELEGVQGTLATSQVLGTGAGVLARYSQARANRTSPREVISEQWRGYGIRTESGTRRHRHVVIRLFPLLYYGIIPG